MEHVVYCGPLTQELKESRDYAKTGKTNRWEPVEFRLSFLLSKNIQPLKEVKGWEFLFKDINTELHL
jgi:hypothetical protein